MIYHILNGDALKEQFPVSLDGKLIIMREILIEGPVQEESFFANRATYIQDTFDVSKEEYHQKSELEIQKINAIPNNAEVNLWFEDDLFCQCNLWFCTKQLTLQEKKFKINLVRPDSDSWHGFGAMDQKSLESAYKNKVVIGDDELASFIHLWDAYANAITDIPADVVQTLRPIIPRISLVLDAHIQRTAPNNRPYESLKKIIDDSEDKSFRVVFKKFTEVEGIYGYGDSSIKVIYDQILSDR